MPRGIAKFPIKIYADKGVCPRGKERLGYFEI